MLSNYLTTSLRALRRRLGYAALNIGGLAVGLAACLLIGLYVGDALRYDAFHPDADRVVRLATTAEQPSGEARTVAAGGWPVGQTLREARPEVEALTYLRSRPSYAVKRDGRYYYHDLIWADGAFFDVLGGFDLQAGDPATALAEPYSLVVTPAVAEQHFGTTERVVGRTLTLRDSLTFTVTGLARVPDRSHVQFEMIGSFATLCSLFDDDASCTESFSSGWFDLNVANYARLAPGTSVASFDRAIDGVYMDGPLGERLGKMGYTLTAHAEPLTDVYLRTDWGNDFGPLGDLATVQLLAAIGGFILLIACINFVNLATARSSERAREVGVRKALGSTRGALVTQFLAEAVVLSLGATVLAVGLAALALPLMSDLAGIDLAFATLAQPGVGAALVGLALAVGVGAGLYPAFVLARFGPAATLRGDFATSARGQRLRQGLVVVQFTLSCALIISTLVVVRQLDHMQGQDVGFQKEQVVVLDLRRADVPLSTQATLLDEIRQHPGVASASATFGVPGRSGWRGQVAVPEGRSEDEGLSTYYLAVDTRFVETFGLKVLAGRAFDASYGGDAPDVEPGPDNTLLLNETAVRQMGLGTPAAAVGTRITAPSGYPEGTVVGVVNDYHHTGLREAVPPMVLDVNPDVAQFAAVRLTDGAAAPDVLDHAAAVWDRLLGAYAFDTFFLDDDFARLYERERRLARIYGTFAGLAILVACLGLFGLAAYTAEQRTKEIGIRKTMGASARQIVLLLSRDFAMLVAVAFVVAAPVAYWAMERWLTGFATRIDLGPGLFALAGLLAFGVAALTVGSQAYRAARLDPVAAIRDE